MKKILFAFLMTLSFMVTDGSSTTPLHGILLKYKDMSTLLSFVKELQTMLQQETLPLDDESHDVYEREKHEQDRIIQELKIILVPFKEVLELTSKTTEPNLVSIKTHCQTAIQGARNIPPVSRVVWMIEHNPSSNVFDDMDLDESKMYEEQFNIGDTMLLLVDDKGNHTNNIDFTKMTMLDVLTNITKRIWRD